MSPVPPTVPATSGPLFGSRPPERTPVNVLPWAIAGAVVLVAVVVLIVMSHKPKSQPNALLPVDPYASSLVFGGLEMSESSSYSGGKSTFIDGRVRNGGPRTVTGVTLQVLFANSEALPPQVETVPLALIRTRQPYVDTQPVAAAPLAPGDEREFRLIFEDIGANWNQQLPEIRVVHVTTR